MTRYGVALLLLACGGAQEPAVRAEPEPEPRAEAPTEEATTAAEPEDDVEPTAEAAPADPLDFGEAAVRSLPWLREVPERTCHVADFELPHDQWEETGFEQLTYGPHGRVTRRDWNSNPVALSGHTLFRRDRRGELRSVREVPYESIEGGRPRPTTTPVTVRRRADEQGRREVRETEGATVRRWVFDDAGNVVQRDLELEEEVRTATCERDETGRLVRRVRSWRHGRVTQDFLWEASTLVGIRTQAEGGEAWDQRVRSTPRGFVVFAEESAVRYQGACVAALLDECANGTAPRPARDADPAAEADVTIGRPLPPSLRQSVRFVDVVDGRSFVVLGPAETSGSNADPDDMTPVVDAAEGPAIPMVVYGGGGRCSLTGSRRVRLTVFDPFDADDGSLTPVAFDAVELTTECDAELAIVGAPLRQRWHGIVGVDDDERDRVRTQLTDGWRVESRRAPSHDDICLGVPTHHVFEGDREVGTIPELEGSVRGVLQVPGEVPLAVVQGMARVYLLPLGGDDPAEIPHARARQLLPHMVGTDWGASPCL